MFSWTTKIHYISGKGIEALLSINLIEGVQGRYFIPIIPLLFLFPISEKVQKLLKYIPVNLCLVCGMVVSCAYTIVTLLDRYWI